MAAKTNTVITTTTDLTAVRAVDFVSRFSQGVALLNDIFPNIRMIEHKPGEQLYSRKAHVTLNEEAVAEGDEIPYNEVTFENVAVGEIDFDKQSVGISLEAISKSGYEATVQAADDDMLYKIENKIATKLVNFMTTGTLTSEYTTSTLQSAIAEAVGQVSAAWEDMNLGYSEIVGFCNTNDLYRALGTAQITTQREFGLTYIKDYLGCSKLFFSSKIPSGTVIATPGENIVMDYINVANSDFAKAGFNFFTDGERNLIGVSIDSVTNRAVSEMVMICGVGLRAEYLNGIAVIKITSSDSTGA